VPRGRVPWLSPTFSLSDVSASSLITSVKIDLTPLPRPPAAAAAAAAAAGVAAMLRRNALPSESSHRPGSGDTGKRVGAEGAVMVVVHS